MDQGAADSNEQGQTLEQCSEGEEEGWIELKTKWIKFYDWLIHSLI